MSRQRPRTILFAALVISTVTAAGARAQNPGAKVSLMLEDQRVRFTAPGGSLDWRLEVVTEGRLVFDSGFVSGSALEWSLEDQTGQAIAGGLYDYTLTIKGPSDQGVRTRRGQLLIERGKGAYRVTAIASAAATDPDLALEAVSGPDAAPSPAAETRAAVAAGSGHQPTGAFRQPLSPQLFAPQPLISGSGTTSTMTKWLDGPSGVVGDTNVTEVNGSVIVGNGTFRGNLQIFGPSDKDVFAGMGPNLITGPGFNYGYAGESFGRSAGFFNVRPDASAVAPNPSLRFMTANAQRMIITNLGRVGIGPPSSLPNHQVRITGGPLWTSNAWQGALELESAAAIGWRPNSAGYSGGLGHTDTGLYLFNTLSEPANTVNPANYHLFIENTGRVGIGTLTPIAQLDVQSTLASTVVDAAVSGSAPGGTGVFGVGARGVWGVAQGQGIGVLGSSDTGTGVVARSNGGNLMEGFSSGFRKFHITDTGTYVAGSDFAEALPVDDRDQYEPGDVLIISERTPGAVEKATRPYDTRVAGVFSTRPGMLGADKNGSSRVDANDVPVAIVGIVPTKVSTENGAVRVGDLLTTSAMPGHAMKASPVSIGGAKIYPTGTILGKAIEPLDHGRGVIKVLITLK